MKLERLFDINQNIWPRHTLYDADHIGIVAKGINNGISHIFLEYKHYNNWDDKLIDSLLAKIALASNTERKTGLKAIREYIENYSEEFTTDLQIAKEIEQKLKQ